MTDQPAAAVEHDQANTYQIRGLQVPYLENQMAELRADITSLRTLLTETAAAVVRVDADVQVILRALGADEP